MAYVGEWVGQMRATQHADFAFGTVGYDFYFPPRTVVVTVALAAVDNDAGGAAAGAIIGGETRQPDGSDQPFHLPAPGVPQAVCARRFDNASHLAIQLTVAKADATIVHRLAFYE